MAGSIVNTYGSTNTDLTNLMIVMDGTRRGHDSISLTNMSTTSVPAIAAGGQIEIAGSLYQFGTEEAISTTGVTSTADATWYVRLTASSSEVTAAFSTVAPTWREDYCGWYYSTASADRYINFSAYYSSAIYTNKIFFNLQNSNYKFKHLQYLSTAGTRDITIAHAITNAYSADRIFNISVRNYYPTAFHAELSTAIQLALVEYAGANITIDVIGWNDTNIYMHTAAVSGVSVVYKLLITYI